MADIIEVNKLCRSDIILLPSVVTFLDFQSLITLPLLNKEIGDVVRNHPEDINYWPILCVTFAMEAGLYSPYFQHHENVKICNLEAKNHFMNVLWPRRKKFPVPPNPLLFRCHTCESTGFDTALRSNFSSEFEKFTVRVACRFRPGEQSTNTFALPFHQFLKLKRKQVADKATNSCKAVDGSSFTVGSCDPEELCDPFLGTLMREPVMLLTSNRVVDRSIAVHSIHRYGRDPFNNKPLSMHQLIPQPELAERIAEWRLKSAEERHRNTNMTCADVKPLVDMATCMDADVIQALMDAERLDIIARLAESSGVVKPVGGDGFEVEVSSRSASEVPESDANIPLEEPVDLWQNADQFLENSNPQTDEGNCIVMQHFHDE